MVAGALLLKYASESKTIWAEVLGICVVAAGSLTLPWSVRRYETLHRSLRSGAAINDSRMLGSVALVTITLSGGALLLVILDVVT